MLRNFVIAAFLAAASIGADAHDQNLLRGGGTNTNNGALTYEFEDSHIHCIAPSQSRIQQTDVELCDKEQGMYETHECENGEKLCCSGDGAVATFEGDSGVCLKKFVVTLPDITTDGLQRRLVKKIACIYIGVICFIPEVRDELWD